jgi:hypothetical protein
MQTSTIRPGLLVSLKTSVSGNVTYRKQDIETDHLDTDGARKAKWETERTINDPVEYEEATKLRSKTRSLITAVCAASSFGLLCPQDRGEELAAAVREAQDLAADFNRRATQTRVQVYVIAGRIASDDVEASRAINSEMRDLLDRMEQGVRNLDVETIRDAANKAKQIGAMVSPEASERLQKAIETARSAARKIVKAGETAAAEVDLNALRAITQSRTAFLDLSDQGEIAAPVVTGRAIDMESEPTELRPDPTNPRIEMDLEDEPAKLAAAPAAVPQLELI